MNFNISHEDFSNSVNNSDTMDTNWQEIFHTYLLKLENDTRTVLQMINDDIERTGSTFNQKLKDSLLRLTNAR